MYNFHREFAWLTPVYFIFLIKYLFLILSFNIELIYD